MNNSKIYSKHDIAAPTARYSTVRRQVEKKKQPCVKYTRIPLFRNTHITDSHQNILLILCSKNTVVMIQFQTTIIYSSVGEEGEIKTNCTLKAQLYKLT